MTNRLINETSPYLLQHAHNPVDWYPWGAEALGRARAEDKPILLSIGYSACHWCHVMERESFEDEETARLMNEHFVSIKVDREERPDLDAIYMSAVQSMTGHGGWPMTVFLTPETVPFFGGTYFPPVDHPRMASFRRVLTSVSTAYRERRDDIEKNARQMRMVLQRGAAGRMTPGMVRPEVLDQAFQELAGAYDPTFGGFGGAPKFPQPMNLEFLLRTHIRTSGGAAGPRSGGHAPALRGMGDPKPLAILEHTLRCMANGGIYDHLGGGFHRYCVDAHWLVPHFEKMLYDNAQLARLYLHAYQATSSEFYKRVVEETLDYVLREMTDAEGGFYSTQDADSEGEEGKFYVWSQQELQDVLGSEDAEVFGQYYGVTPGGNFEGRNILHVPDGGRAEGSATDDATRGRGTSPRATSPTQPQRAEARTTNLGAARRKLLGVRSRRVWPALDDKVITSWNGLMLTAFAEAGAGLGRDDYVAAAQRNAGFVLEKMYRDGRLLRTYRGGQAKIDGYLEDYAFYGHGLLALYEADFDIRWFQAARAMADTICHEFWDDTEGGFFDTGTQHEQLVKRPKEFMDNATPCGNSVATELLLRLGRLTGNQEYQQKAVQVLRLLVDLMGQHPTAFGYMLGALDFYVEPGHEIALVADPATRDAQALLAVVRTRYLPHKVMALKRPGDLAAEDAIALLEDRDAVNGLPTAYVCQNFACQLPATDPQTLARQLGLPPL